MMTSDIYHVREVGVVVAGIHIEVVLFDHVVIQVLDVSLGVSSGYRLGEEVTSVLTVLFELIPVGSGMAAETIDLHYPVNSTIIQSSDLCNHYTRSIFRMVDERHAVNLDVFEVFHYNSLLKIE